MKNIKKRFIAVACAALTIISCIFTSMPAYAVSNSSNINDDTSLEAMVDAVKAEENVVDVQYVTVNAKSGSPVASSGAEFTYDATVNVTVPAGRTAKTLRVIGTRNGDASTGATAQIKSSQWFSSWKSFNLDGAYHDFGIWSVTNKTCTYTVRVNDFGSNYTGQSYRVAVILLN